MTDTTPTPAQADEKVREAAVNAVAKALAGAGNSPVVLEMARKLADTALGAYLAALRPEVEPVARELLPCPFCGSTNIDPEGWVSTERKGPACDDCAGSADTVELWNSRPFSQAGAGGVVVKPLEWHRSHMTPWNGDYHTVPTGYSVRCADENGWKWQGLGAHGYASSPEGAQARAQEHHSAYVRAALAASPSAGEPVCDRFLWTDKPCTCGGADCEQVDFGNDATPPAPVQTASVEALAFQSGLDAAAEYLLACDDYGDRLKAAEIRKLVPPASLTAPTQGEPGDATIADRLRYTADINANRFDDRHPLVAELREAAELIDRLSRATSSSPAGGVREALERLDRLFTYPVAAEINPRRYGIRGTDTDTVEFAVEIIRAALSAAQAGTEAAEPAGVREALAGLLDACEAHNEANGRQMIDPHAECAARAALSSPATGEVVEAEPKSELGACQRCGMEMSWSYDCPNRPDPIYAISTRNCPDARAALNPAPGHGEGGL